MFFGAIYAGAWPVPLPLPTRFGGKEAYIDQLAVQLNSCRSGAAALSARARRDGRRRRGAIAASTAIDWASFAAARRPTVDAAPGRAGRHRLSAIFERLDPLPARRRDHPPRAAAATSPPTPIGMHIGRRRPLRLLAALVSRHGPGRLHAVAGRQPDVGRLSQDRGFRPPPARLARPDQPQPGHDAELFADLRLRHLRAPHLEPDRRRRPLRPVALAGRRQRRRHDPPRRDAGFVDAFAAAGLQGQRASCRATASPKRRWRSRSCRRAKASSSSWSRRPCSPAAARASATGRSATAPIVNCGKPVRDMEVEIRGDDGSRARRARDRQGLVPRHLGHGRLFPRRGSDRRLPASMAGSTPATWATCRTAISTSSAAPRT